MIRFAFFAGVLWSLAAAGGSFEEWQRTHRPLRAYAGVSERRLREAVWRDNAAYVDWYNSLDTGVTLELNQFADMTHEEFKAIQRTQPSPPGSALSKEEEVDLSGKSPPTSKDWRTEGAVSPVKNQADCGSCYAFAAVGAVEGQLAQQEGKVVGLSEQQIVDCCPTTFGCNGGKVEDVFEFLKTHSLATEASYPYTGVEGACQHTAPGATKVRSWARVKKYKEAELQAAVGLIGPVSVGIDSGERSMQFYKGGIYSDPMCMTSRIDHGVLVVGYGSEGKDRDYWIVKNSWGEAWGENGYLRIQRNKRNMCGIASMAVYPLLD